MKTLRLIVVGLFAGFAFVQEGRAARLESIRCAVTEQAGENADVQLQMASLTLGIEPVEFVYASDEKGLDVVVSAMNADDDRFALVNVGLRLHGYDAASQFFTDGREITDVSISAPGETRITYVVSCYR